MAKIYKSAQIFLTLVLGHITGIVFYDSFVIGIHDLVVDSTSYYNITRVSLGAFLLVIVVIGLVATWKKLFTLQLVNGFFLLVSLLVYAFVTTVQLARVYDKLETIEKYKSITDIALKSVILVIAMFLSFSMSSNSSYSMLPISDRMK